MSLNHAFERFPRLQTARLSLREMGQTDAQALYAVLSDDKVTEYYDDDPFTGLSEAQAQIEAWNNGYEGRRCIRWGIAPKQDDMLIGTCGYYSLHRWHRRGAIGYELARPFWRQGIMTGALRAIIGYGFDEMELIRIQATVMPGNLASVRLLEGLGFQQEGVLRGYERWGSKGYLDLLMFSLLRREHEQHQRTMHEE
jgi:ribosomal-protein-alanine N-acetyltransferase